MAEIPPVNGKARFSFKIACSCAAPRTCAQRHERFVWTLGNPSQQPAAGHVALTMGLGKDAGLLWPLWY